MIDPPGRDDRDETALLRALLSHARGVLYALDADLILRYWSAGATQALGWTEGEVVGRYGPSLLHPDDLLQTGQPPPDGRGETDRFTYRVRHKDGSWHVLEAVVSNHLGDPAIRAVIVDAQDVTHQRALEVRAVRARKLEALGRLSGGVAHSLNNLLTVVLSWGGLIREALARGELVDPDDVGEIVAAGERARALTQQIRAFTRPRAADPVPVDVGEALQSAAPMFGHLVGEDVDLSTHVSTHGWRVACTPDQVHAMLLELVTDARARVPDGGAVTVRAEACPGAAEDAVGAPPDGVCLRVEARGPGARPARDPAALAGVQEIALSLGGRVEVEGDEVSVWLPRTDTDRDRARARADTAAPVGAGELVLVVEDDLPVARATARVLHLAGYRVLTAASAEAAATLAATLPAVDLILADVVLPGPDGAQAVAEVRRRHPEARVLYVSGHTARMLDRHDLREGHGAPLSKPWTTEALLTRVREALEDAPTAPALSGDVAPARAS